MQHAYRSTELAPEERATVERLLGRPLENDEAVEVITYRVGGGLGPDALRGRRRAVAQILELSKGKTLGAERAGLN